MERARTQGEAQPPDWDQDTTDERESEPVHKSFDGPARTPAGALLEFAGAWVGDDLEDMLDLVYRTRGKAAL